MRIAQRVAIKAGMLSYERNNLRPFEDVRRAVLGPAAAVPPRLLVRVDEFPNYDAYDRPEATGLDASRRFHSIMAEAGVPHLMAVLPQLTHDALDPSAFGGRPLGDAEVELPREMESEGVTFAQHGTTHRTRHRSPRRHSEFCGLSPEDAAAVIDRGLASLAKVGVKPRAFVPPFSRFDANQYGVLSERIGECELLRPSRQLLQARDIGHDDRRIQRTSEAVGELDSHVSLGRFQQDFHNCA